MSGRPFHHGNLRTVLLDEAETALRHGGLDGLSLRELARRADVSHGAPRSHFIDRKALLDALAERGFLRLASEMRTAADLETQFAEALRAAARAYVGFAVSNAALLDLMFAAKVDRPPETLLAAAETLFTTVSDIMRDGVDAHTFPESQRERLTLLMSATMQGISTFVASGRTDAAQTELLIDDAVSLILSGQVA